MAEICTNLTAFFHTEQGCFSIYHHTCTYTPSVASQPLKVLNLFTGGTDAPLSPFPEYFSVKGGANTTALGLERSLQAELGGVSLFSCPSSPSISSHFFPGLYSNHCEGLCSACSGAELPLTCREGQPLFGVDVVVCDHTDQ